MKLSWSKKLFLRINKTIGKRPWLDTLMYFSGQWLIFVLGCVCGLLIVYMWYENSWRETFLFLKIFGGAVFLAYFISYTIAIIFHHPRPVRELPNVKELIIPLETWKSFPSDHTIAATLMTVFSLLASNSWVVMILVGVAALLVMAGRVYCGVHYPRDIIGGIIVALFSWGVVMGGYALYILSIPIG